MRLQLTPYCQMCGRLATVADHLDGTDYEDDSASGASWLNIGMTRALCSSCHGTRTGQQGNRASRGLPTPVAPPLDPVEVGDAPYEI